MTRTAELTLLLADGEISAEQIAELMGLVSSPENRAECLALMKVEAMLRGLRKVDAVTPTMTWLQSEMERRIVSGVMARIPVSVSPVRPDVAARSSVVRKSRRWLLVAAGVAVLGFMAAFLFKKTPLPVGEIVSVNGDVQILVNGKKRGAKVGEVIRTDERLLVGFESSADIQWAKENALLVVTEMSDLSWVDADVCELKSGGLSADVVSRAGKSPLFFKTPDAMARITGTKFSLHRSANATQLRVSEGRVVLSDSDARGSADVTAGQFASASDAAAPVSREWPGDGTGVGLLGEYYNHNYQKMDVEPPAYERLDARIRFQWGKGAPTPVTQSHPEHFGVRWTGYIEPRFSESYTFLLVVDDGVRMWVDDRQILDAWDSNNAKKFYTQPVELKVGRKHKIRVEYCERTMHANVSLFWQSLSQPIEIVPQTQLHPPDRSNLPPPAELRARTDKR